jgi:GNAT superfamily N-acetyltransferase
MSVRVSILEAQDLARGLAALAKLRITIFREWPYIYDGSAEYEAHNLSKFAAARRGVIIAAIDGEEIVGCATAAPLAEVDPSFATPFGARREDISRASYFGESMLLPAYRGRGLGRRGAQ